jgi:GNAT superfamily N-acetyltransferase
VSLGLKYVSAETDLALFWRKFEPYIRELLDNCTFGDLAPDDLDYFLSTQYRDTITELHKRDADPLKIAFFMDGDTVFGFIMYVVFAEEFKCFILEYNIDPPYRRKGFGSTLYRMFEDIVRSTEATFIELTCTNKVNECFWVSNGFIKSEEMNVDHNYLYRKQIKSV